MPVNIGLLCKPFFCHPTTGRWMSSCFRLLGYNTQEALMLHYTGGFKATAHRRRVGQNRIYTPYMTVFLVISLPKIPYIHRIFMVLANPTQEALRLLHTGGFEATAHRRL